MPTIYSVHTRMLAVPAERVGTLLDGLSGSNDRLWPRGIWPRLKLDGPLAAGARGGHGPVRYRVAAYEPGRFVTFAFEPRGIGFEGWHCFQVLPVRGGAVLRHVLEARAGLRGMLRWHVAVRYLHDALIEDAFDQAEKAVLGEARAPARWTPWVRILRRLAAAFRPRRERRSLRFRLLGRR